MLIPQPPASGERPSNADGRGLKPAAVAVFALVPGAPVQCGRARIETSGWHLDILRPYGAPVQCGRARIETSMSRSVKTGGPERPSNADGRGLKPAAILSGNLRLPSRGAPVQCGRARIETWRPARLYLACSRAPVQCGRARIETLFHLIHTHGHDERPSNADGRGLKHRLPGIAVAGWRAPVQCGRARIETGGLDTRHCLCHRAPVQCGRARIETMILALSMISLQASARPMRTGED